MNRWTFRHRLASVLITLLFAMADSLKDPMTHMDLRQIARVVPCHNYNCVDTPKPND